MLPEWSGDVSRAADSDQRGHGLPRGTLIMGRFLMKLAHAAFAMTELTLTLQAPDAAELPADMCCAAAALPPGQAVAVQPLSDEAVAGYTLVRDLQGRPVPVPRRTAGFTGMGSSARRALLGAVVVAGLAWGADARAGRALRWARVVGLLPLCRRSRRWGLLGGVAAVVPTSWPAWRAPLMAAGRGRRNPSGPCVKASHITTLMSNLPGMAYRCRNAPDWLMEFVE